MKAYMKERVVAVANKYNLVVCAEGLSGLRVAAEDGSMHSPDISFKKDKDSGKYVIRRINTGGSYSIMGVTDKELDELLGICEAKAKQTNQIFNFLSEFKEQI